MCRDTQLGVSIIYAFVRVNDFIPACEDISYRQNSHPAWVWYRSLHRLNQHHDIKY
jgi:hypothetical protein